MKEKFFPWMRFSGVIELMRTGKISITHADFKDLSYSAYLQKYCKIDGNSTSNTDVVNPYKLQSAYETASEPIMPYTNFTYGMIDECLEMTSFCFSDMISKELLIMSFIPCS